MRGPSDIKYRPSHRFTYCAMPPPLVKGKMFLAQSLEVEKVWSLHAGEEFASEWS